jgi:hypothetical protein
LAAIINTDMVMMLQGAIQRTNFSTVARNPIKVSGGMPVVTSAITDTVTPDKARVVVRCSTAS